jgi:solute:Na+ symporter, SSS family
MKLHGADVAIIIGYILLSVLIGFWISRKASKGLQAYFLGDNSLKWWMLGFSNSAGMFDVSGAAWMVSMVFVYGVNVYWQQWAWPVWNQVFLMSFLAIWLRRSKVMTGAEWISFRFGNDRGAKASHLITVVFAILVAVAFIVYMTIGIGKFADSILPWNIAFGGLNNAQTYSVIIILLTTVYSVKGGMYSVVATEIMQYVIMVISCILVAWLAMNLVSKETIDNFFPAGWDQLAVKMQVDLDWQSKWPAVNDKIDADGFREFGLVFGMMAFKGIWSSLAGPVPSYDMQRVLSTRSPKEAAKMNAFTMIVLYFPLYLMVAGILVLGIHYFNVAQMTGDEGKPNLEALLGMVISQLPVGLKGLIIAGMMAAFMSTFSAFVNSGPAYIVNDIYKKYIKPNATDKQYLRVSYISCALLVVTGLIIGLGISNISTMFDIITGGLYAGFVVPNVLKWIWHRLNGWGYFAGMLTGILVSVIFILYWKQWSGGKHIVLSFPINMVLSLAAAITASYLTRSQDMESLQKFYTTTKPWGFWKPVKEMALKNISGFEPNKNFIYDLVNVVVGITWQMTMIIMPVYIVIKEYQTAFLFFVVWLACMMVLRFTWWKRLDKM